MNSLEDEMGSVDPLKRPNEFSRIIWNYLKPRGKPAPRAHLFTINGLTYPIHRDFGFVAVPDPAEVTGDKGSRLRFSIRRSRRRYSMLAYLFSVRPGDLVFFFQADPQYPKDIWNRRGFRGIWVAASGPFRDTTTIKHRWTGYEVLGMCPQCGSPFDFGEGELVGGSRRCRLCGGEYGSLGIGKDRYSRVVLSARLLIRPLVVFKKTAGDNRIYSDLTISPLIWISRADNAMGPGKGSSIRTLLPEEATKIAYMLTTEDGQGIDDVKVQPYPGAGQPITDHNAQPATLLRAVHGGKRKGWVLEHEFHLNLYFAMNIDAPGGSVQQALKMPLDKVEWWTTEFPWGYTGDAADFTLTLWDGSRGRYAIYLFEFKKDDVDRRALAEVLLYVPWVAQVSMNAPLCCGREVEVQPVLVGKDCKLKYVPDEYNLDIEYTMVPTLDSILRSEKVIVRPPIILCYSIRDRDRVAEIEDSARRKEVCYVRDLALTRIDVQVRAFKPPPPTFTTTDVEKDFVIQKYLQGF
jgi:hypothetical protein